MTQLIRTTCSLLLALLLCQPVAADDKPVGQVVMYTADWCGPCQRFRGEVIPYLISKGWRVGPGKFSSGTGELNHLRLIESSDLPLPRFEVYRDGVKVDQWVGFAAKEVFIARVRASFPQPKKQELETKPQELPAKKQELWNYNERTILQ